MLLVLKTSAACFAVSVLRASGIPAYQFELECPKKPGVYVSDRISYRSIPQDGVLYFDQSDYSVDELTNRRSFHGIAFANKFSMDLDSILLEIKSKFRKIDSESPISLHPLANPAKVVVAEDKFIQPRWSELATIVPFTAGDTSDVIIEKVTEVIGNLQMATKDVTVLYPPKSFLFGKGDKGREKVGGLLKQTKGLDIVAKHFGAKRMGRTEFSARSRKTLEPNTDTQPPVEGTRLVVFVLRKGAGKSTFTQNATGADAYLDFDELVRSTPEGVEAYLAFESFVSKFSTTDLLNIKQNYTSACELYNSVVEFFYDALNLKLDKELFGKKVYVAVQSNIEAGLKAPLGDYYYVVEEDQPKTDSVLENRPGDIDHLKIHRFLTYWGRRTIFGGKLIAKNDFFREHGVDLSRVFAQDDPIKS